MARIPIKKDKIPKKNKEMSEALLIEENRLSVVMEQRKTLEKTLKGVEKAIVAAEKKLKTLEAKVATNDKSFEQKEKELETKDKELETIRSNVNNTKKEIADLKIECSQNKKDIESDAIRMLADLDKEKKEKQKEISVLAAIQKEKEIEGEGIKEANKVGSIALNEKRNAAKNFDNIIKDRVGNLRRIKEEIKKLKLAKEELEPVKIDLISKKKMIAGLQKDIEILKEEKKNAERKRNKVEKSLNEKIKLSYVLDTKKAAIDESMRNLEIKAKTLQKHYDKSQIPIKVYPLNI